MTPKETVLAFLSAAEKMNIDAALEYVSADCEYTNLPMGTVHGPQGIRGAIEPVFAPIEENEFKLLRIAADGPIVIVERLDRHRAARGWFELPVTGVFEVRDGRIAVWREYFDLATFQAGMAANAAAA